MKTILFIVLFILQFSLYSQEIYKKSTFLMGSDFEFTVVATNESEAEKGFAIAIEEVKRIEELISSWKPNSQTSLINSNAGIKAVKVDYELFDLIIRSQALSNITDGAFDITYASMDKIWGFSSQMKKLPSKRAIEASVSKVGSQKIIINHEDTSIFLPEEGMKIGFGAIGKGYAADMVEVLLIEEGFSSGIINASGDMNVWGSKPDGEPWMVAIKNPLSKEKAFALFPILYRSVVTSGDY